MAECCPACTVASGAPAGKGKHTAHSESDMTASASAKKLLEAIGVLKSADPRDVAAISADLLLEKAAQSFAPGEGAEYVRDRWQEGEMHKNPSKEEIKTGPSQESSGGGAEKMIREYSDYAPQHGIQLTAEKFEHIMAPLNSSMKSLAASQKLIVDSLTAMNTTLTAKSALLSKAAKKADDEEEEDEEDEEEESEVVEINASRAKSLIDKAKKLHRSIKAQKAKMNGADDTEKEDCKAKIKSLSAKLASVLAKAQATIYGATGAAELAKSINTLAAKADINVVQEEEEEEDEDEEEEGEGKGKGKSAAAAAAATTAAPADASKAKTDDAGNQADRKDPSNGNQAAAAKSLEDSIKALGDRLEKALGQGAASAEALKPVQMSINQLFDVVSGKSKLAAVPDIMKSAPQLAESGLERLTALEASGQIDESAGWAIRDILGKAKLAREGKIDGTIVNECILRSSAAVQEFFRQPIAQAA